MPPCPTITKPTGPPRPVRAPRVPVDTVSGRPVEEAAQIYRAEGFEVQVIDLDVNPIADAMFNTNRIRLVIRDGLVVQATQG